jgi:hypothetical protein
LVIFVLPSHMANGWDDDIALLTALSHLSALMFGPIFAFNNVLFRILA